MNDKPINLDRLAAQHAQEIFKKVNQEKVKQANQEKVKQANQEIETTVTKALGVLQEEGVYACFLYLLAKGKENGKIVVDEMLDLLGDGDDGSKFGWGKPTSNKPDDILSHITTKVTVNLERLLLAKETLEQMLIYARYGAKARQESDSSGGQSNNREGVE
ncbi:MAG: hypothetical protein N2235_26260 [Fischerella sp.]|nr:hypothetical protein [Fischerella sp.]